MPLYNNKKIFLNINSLKQIILFIKNWRYEDFGGNVSILMTKLILSISCK